MSLDWQDVSELSNEEGRRKKVSPYGQSSSSKYSHLYLDMRRAWNSEVLTNRRVETSSPQDYWFYLRLLLDNGWRNDNVIIIIIVKKRKMEINRTAEWANQWEISISGRIWCTPVAISGNKLSTFWKWHWEGSKQNEVKWARAAFLSSWFEGLSVRDDLPKCLPP